MWTGLQCAPLNINTGRQDVTTSFLVSTLIFDLSYFPTIPLIGCVLCEGDRWAGSIVWSPGPALALNSGPGPPPGSAAACALWLCGPASAATESGQPELPRGGYEGDQTGTGTRPPPIDRGPAGQSPILPLA